MTPRADTAQRTGSDAAAAATPRPLPPMMAEVKDRAIEVLHERLRERGFGDIRPGHGCVFRFMEGEGVRMTEIAERAHMTKQAVGEVVADLERLGYVERVPDPGDGRAKIIRFTDRGETAYSEGRRIFGEIEADWAERLGAEKLAVLREAVTELAE